MTVNQNVRGSSPRRGAIYNTSLWCNGSTAVSKTVSGGSSPSGDARKKMTVESISTVRDIYNNKDRVTVYKTHVNDVTNKTTVESVQFLYTKNAVIEIPSKGSYIDILA